MLNLKQIVLSVQTRHKTRPHGMNRWIEQNQRSVTPVAVFFPFVQRCDFDWTSQQHPKTQYTFEEFVRHATSPNELRWHVDLCLASVLDHLSLRRFSLANSSWLDSRGGRPARLVFLASGMTGESETQANVDKIENIITWHVENRECDNGPFAMENVSTCPFPPGDNEWIDEWMDCEGAFTLRSSLSLGDHIVILGYDRSAIWMIEDPWWAKCR